MILTKIKRCLVWIMLVVIFVTQIYPLIWLLLYSVKNNQEILSGELFSIPGTLQWDNYKTALEAGSYFRYLGNSLFVTGVTLVLTLLLSAMVSYAVTRFQWRLGKLVILFFMIGIMIPMQSTLLPLVVLFNKLHILDTHLSLILPYIAFSIPIAVFILSGFFGTVPKELEESAAIDGASVYKTFFRIMLPVIVPPMMTVTILTFISIWNEYIMASTFISSKALKTLPFGIYSFFSQYSTNYGAIGAYLVMGALPVLLIYFALAERISQGMVAGAIKG